MSFILLYYLPYFLESKNIVTIFTSLNPLVGSLLMPIVIIICYLIHLFFIGLITRWFWGITEKKSPSKSGNIPRNIPSKTLNYYHIRSFMIKYPKNAMLRGPFPWLIKWLYNFVGTNKIGKGSVVEEEFSGDRFVEIGSNSYIGTGSAISSHAVDGIFGNISYSKIRIGNNVTTAGYNCIGPGVEIGDNATLLPLTGATKNNILKNDNYYFGVPLRRIFKKRLLEYLQISEEELKKADDLFNEYNQNKKEVMKAE